MDFFKKYPIAGLCALMIVVLAILVVIDIVVPRSMGRRSPVHQRSSFASFTLWRNMWLSSDGTLRREYSEPADERLSAAAQDVFSLAHEKGFIFTDPSVWQTTSAYHSVVILGSIQEPHGDPIFGRALLARNRILISSGYMQLMSEIELRVLISHELGHIVDGQTERLDDARLRQWAHLPEQAFANRFAAELMGDVAVTDFLLEWVGQRGRMLQ